MRSSELTYLGLLLLFLVPVTTGIVQALKVMAITTSRWAVIASIFVGLILVAVCAMTDVIEGFDFKDDLVLVVCLGVIVGLAASGLYSGLRSLLGPSTTRVRTVETG